MKDFAKIVKDFIVNEGYNPPDGLAYIQSVDEVLSNITPRTRTDERRLMVAKESLKNLRRELRRLQERVKVLEEDLVNRE